MIHSSHTTKTLFISLLFLSIILAGCSQTAETEPTCSLTGNTCTLPSDELGSVDTAKEILQTLKNKDIQTFSTYIHPAKKTRFSPYTYVNVETDLTMDAQELLQAYQDTGRIINRGTYDGSGEPINLTAQQYFQRFVYDTDFLNAPEIVENQEIMRGNVINNIADIYKNVEIIEFYIPGMNPKYGGMDRRSLTLVLEKTDGKRYLIGIVHNEWTT